MRRSGWWAQSCGGQLLPGAKHPMVWSHHSGHVYLPAWTAPGRGKEHNLFIYFFYFIFTFLKGGSPSESKWVSLNNIDSRNEGKMVKCRDDVGTFLSSLKGTWSSVLISHSSIVPWPLGYHPFQFVLTPALSLSTILLPPTAYYALFVCDPALKTC